MWFLEHESAFGGKRIWLKPGSQQLFGRTKPSADDNDAKTWTIENKAVSRKHVILKVLPPPSENGTKLHTRSQVEVTDLSCRQGTTIDGENTLKSQKGSDGTIEYSKATLNGTEHTIRLAQGYPPFKLVWKPIVFTYASKETKEVKARNVKLHALDIKTTTDFQFNQTTHVISQKRNLPKVLAGLTSAKYIVTSDFLDAVIKAATSTNDPDLFVPSLLEEDFDTWWPNEKEYVPPVGAEPVPQPKEKLEPDHTRSEVFSGLTFVFLDESQYNSLSDPVTGGGGKALLYELNPGTTTVQEYVDYVRSVAGKKKRKSGDSKLPVITVRLQTLTEDMEAWAADFVTRVDQTLNQRSFLQNEFLDVILTKDKTALQRPPPPAEASIPSTAPQPDTTSRSLVERARMSQNETTPNVEAQQENAGNTREDPPDEPEPTQRTIRKRTHRPKTVSRFTGFDDDYETPPKRRKVDNTQVDAAPDQMDTSADQTQMVSPPRESIEKKDKMATMFPTVAAITAQRAATRGLSASVDPETGGPVKSPKSKTEAALEKFRRADATAKSKEFNVREAARKRAQELDERRQADEEMLRETLEGIDISEMRNLAQIEEMEIVPREPRGRNSTSQRQSQARAAPESDRWKEEWNGRRNFKRFKRRGAEQGAQQARVLVALEEAAPKRGVGIVDSMMLDEAPEPSFRSARAGASARARSRCVEDDEDDSEPEVGFTRPSKRNTPAASQTQTQGRGAAAVPEVINVEDSDDDAPVMTARSQRSSGRSQRVAETQVQEQSTSTSTAQRGKKRAAAAAVAEAPVRKKGRTARRDEDSDGEETGFRFRKRRG